MLEEENGGTRVTVAMSGFASLPDDAYRERIGPSSAGWEKGLANLKAYVECGVAFSQGYVAAMLGYRREAEAKYAVERSIWIGTPRGTGVACYHRSRADSAVVLPEHPVAIVRAGGWREAFRLRYGNERRQVHPHHRSA